MSDYSHIEPLRLPVPPSRQRAKRHYGVHPYFTRRSWRVVQAYVERFSRQGDLVLDPFGGSGVTATEALVLRRRGCQVDLNPLASFLAKQIAVSPVSLEALARRFHEVKRCCEARIAHWRRAGGPALAEALEGFDYPRNVPLPRNADAQFVHELFTPRQLVSLACLRQEVLQTPDAAVRDLLLLAFSATLAKTNRTFISATGRKPSRGGASIFSLYRYNVPGNPVELDVWEQFEARVASLLTAKRETNQLIGDWYSADTFRAITGSATRLAELVGAETADYIYTDPPYGAHIAYLDLSTMWNAWLGFPVAEADRAEEVIEGGDVGHTSADYTRLLDASIHQMCAALKPGRWLSLVFCHRDLGYWSTIRESAERAGFRLANTVVQPLDVVWSMHRKKNPLRVLAGELILNFLKPRARVRAPRAAPRPSDATLLRTIRLAAETAIGENGAATTEEIYYVLIPRLLESCLATEASANGFDLVTTLGKQGFRFNEASGKWELPPGYLFDPDLPAPVRARAYLRQCLADAKVNGRPAELGAVLSYLAGRVAPSERIPEDVVLRELRCVGRPVRDDLWELREPTGQTVMF